MLPADKLLLERIGARLRELRTAADLTQDQVGDRAGFSGKYIGEIEKGVRDVPMSTLRAVVENGIGADLEQVLGGRPAKRVESHARFARDVELTAELLARLPMSVRRPMSMLVREVSDLDAQRAPIIARAAEARRSYQGNSRKPRGRPRAL